MVPQGAAWHRGCDGRRSQVTTTQVEGWTARLRACYGSVHVAVWVHGRLPPHRGLQYGGVACRICIARVVVPRGGHPALASGDRLACTIVVSTLRLNNSATGGTERRLPTGGTSSWRLKRERAHAARGVHRNRFVSPCLVNEGYIMCEWPAARAVACTESARASRRENERSQRVCVDAVSALL